MYDYIEMKDVECFNEKVTNQARKVIRPFSEKLKFLTDPTIKLESDYEEVLVIRIPFNCEVRIKAICVAGAPEGFAPSKLKVYKNEQNVDFEIVNDKKPI